MVLPVPGKNCSDKLHPNHGHRHHAGHPPHHALRGHHHTHTHGRKVGHVAKVGHVSHAAGGQLKKAKRPTTAGFVLRPIRPVSHTGHLAVRGGLGAGRPHAVKVIKALGHTHTHTHKRLPPCASLAANAAKDALADKRRGH